MVKVGEVYEACLRDALSYVSCYLPGGWWMNLFWEEEMPVSKQVLLKFWLEKALLQRVMVSSD